MPSVPKGDTVKKRVSSAISLSQDGLFGKACQVLVSPGVVGVVPNNAKTWSLLVSKHPECVLVLLFPPCHLWILVSHLILI